MERSFAMANAGAIRPAFGLIIGRGGSLGPGAVDGSSIPFHARMFQEKCPTKHTDTHPPKKILNKNNGPKRVGQNGASIGRMGRRSVSPCAIERGPGLAMVGLGQLLNTATFRAIGAKGAPRRFSGQERSRSAATGCFGSNFDC